MKNLKDIELVALVRDENSAEAFSELYDRYATKIKRFCQNMVDDHEQVKDIFQDTFVAFYNNIRNQKQIRYIPTYLFAIARNHCYKFYRDRKDFVPIDPEKLFKDERYSIETNELLKLVYDCVQLLELKYREVFVLREIDGLSYKEVAKICGISLSGAKTRYRRAFSMLLKILSPYIEDVQNS